MIRIPSNVDQSFIEGINGYLKGLQYSESPYKIGSWERAIWGNAYTWAEENKITSDNVLEKISNIKNWATLDFPDDR